MGNALDFRTELLRLAVLLALLASDARAQLFSFSGPGGPVPASGTGGGGNWPNVLPPGAFASTLNVPVAVSSICKVKIDGLNHSWSGDVQIVLFDPTGKGHTLLSRPGFNSAGGFGNDGPFLGGGPTEFVRPGTTPIPDASSTPIPPGVYSQHFGDPNGLPWPDGTNGIFNVTTTHMNAPAGNWTLRIYDWEVQDSGSCTSWTLEGNGACFQPPPPPAPVGYCTAKVNSLGCTPTLSSSGIPSATSGSGFLVESASNRNNKPGLLFYGINGRSAVVFQGGLLCVKSPVRRTGGLSSNGSPAPANDCSGLFSIDMNAFAVQTSAPLPIPELLIIGTLVDCQFWGRDPGYAFPNNSSLSAGLEYIVSP